MNNATLHILQIIKDDADVERLAENIWRENGGLALHGDDARLTGLAFQLKVKIMGELKSRIDKLFGARDAVGRIIANVAAESLAGADWVVATQAFDLDMRKKVNANGPVFDEDDPEPFNLDAPAPGPS